MAATNREIVRDALVTLFTSGLTGGSNPAQAVYGHAASDFQGQSPVVLVKGQGVDRQEATYDTDVSSAFLLVVENWVLKADPASGWTEADAEDRLDLLEKAEADIYIANYSHPSGTWDRIFYAGPTQIIETSNAGKPWLVEIVPLRIEKDDTG